VALLALGIAQNVVAPKSLAARKRSQAKLRNFYRSHLDEGDDVAAIIKNRAAFQRRLGIPNDELADLEFSMPFVGTSNTIPTLIWFFLNVFSNEDLVDRIRSEVESVLVTETNPDDGRRTATVDITRLEKECPTLYGCYRETLRKYSDLLGNRRVMADTTLRDPATGREYLLRKGINVQWPTIVTHQLPSVWGNDTHEFKPERFIDTPNLEEKKRRGAMIPFGGGRTLCPGRYFAQAENLAFVGAIAVGFDVEGATVPAASNAFPGTAMQRPDWGDKDPGVKIKRRMEWEDVTWEFKC
jgi:cytochrome P450